MFFGGEVWGREFLRERGCIWTNSSSVTKLVTKTPATTYGNLALPVRLGQSRKIGYFTNYILQSRKIGYFTNVIF